MKGRDGSVPIRRSTVIPAANDIEFEYTEEVEVNGPQAA